MKLKEKINKLGLNYKKEMITLIIGVFIILLVAVAIYFLFENLLLTIASVCLIPAYFVYFVLRYNGIERKKENELIDNFIDYFSFFRIYIMNGENVYTSFQNTISFASADLKPFIGTLLEDMNQDKTITPFMKFSKNFKNKMVEEIMISIYEMIDNGNNTTYIDQFTSIFENFKLRKNKENEDNRIEKFNKFSMSSLAGSGLIMVILVYGIINLIGEII